MQEFAVLCKILLFYARISEYMQGIAILCKKLRFYAVWSPKGKKILKTLDKLGFFDGKNFHIPMRDTRVV